MGKVKKSTKKFSQNRLKQTIERRKANQKIVKGKKQREVKKLNRELAEKAKGSTPTAEEHAAEVGAFHTTAGATADKLAAMSMDDFIKDGFNAVSDEDEEGDDSDASSVLDLDGEEEEEEEEEAEDSELLEEASSEEDEEDGTSKRTVAANKHKKQLEKLKEQDPEFYKYLENNDKSLLNFDVSESEEEEEDEDEAMEDEEDEIYEVDAEEMSEDGADTNEAGAPVQVSQELTKALLTSWEQAIQKDHSLSAARKLVVAFRDAIRSGQQQEDRDAAKYTPTYRVSNDGVFNKVITMSLKLLPTLFAHHLPTGSKAARTISVVTNGPKWKQLSPLVKSFLTNILETFRRVNEPTILQYVLQETEPLTVYFYCFPKLSTSYLKVLLNIWGTGHESTRMLAFLCIRRLASGPQATLLDAALKGIYTTFVRVCKDTNVHTLPAIRVLLHCVVELFGLKLDTAYQHAFLYIRQLAIHLRNALSTRTKDAYRSVYNWQFMHCLKLWSAVLSTYCNARYCADHGNSPLEPLIYPFVQVALGTARLIPTAQYFPQRLHCVSMLVQLSHSTGVFIPLAPTIFEMLESTEMKRKPTPSTLKPLNFNLYTKAPKEYLHTRVYQDGLMERICECLFDYFECHALSIAFPEFATPATVQLKRYIKRLANVKAGKQLQSVVEKLEQQARYIEKQRSGIDFSPQELSKAYTFLAGTDVASTPLGAHVASMRRIKQQREQLLQEAEAAAKVKPQTSRQPQKKKRKQQK